MRFSQAPISPLAKPRAPRHNAAQMRTTTLPLLLLLAAPALAHAQFYGPKYTPCVDYYTVGQSPCQPLASTPLPQAQPRQQAAAPVAQPAPTPADPVKDYLDNYGKPPKEFVEFYLNPTQENALKWVAAYNKMVARSQALSQSWTQADTLYQQLEAKGIDPSALLTSSSLPPVQPFPGLPQPPAQSSGVRQPSAPALASPAPDQHLGAYAAAPAGTLGGPVHLTYYFSATCPYCAKTTPVISNLYNEMSGKLTLTCVDVTPLSNGSKPTPENIIGKLPCNWRTPSEEELADQNIQQTPTMLISRGNQAPVRLSGYVPQDQLRSYITGATATR
ncbi:MAG: thioredoxin fold domain-containing protein [Proteobacteria bacterium]|nr:thioredoxin fold domain-containing protein [Pseudomonadota bacterium]